MNNDLRNGSVCHRVAPFIEDDQLFQQDGVPCHKSAKVLSFFEEEGIALLPDWPSRSPGLNIIEKLREYLKIQVSEHNIQNLQELWTIVQTQSFKIPERFIENLFDSIPRRIDAVIKNKGHPIRY